MRTHALDRPVPGTARSRLYAGATPRTYARHPAEIDDDFVVFLIGAHFAKPWRLLTAIRVVRAMSAMVKELEAKPELGFLGEQAWGARTSIKVQYWRSLEHLMAYARSRDSLHLPAWRHFNQLVSQTTAVGIWHEAYLIRGGEYECIYGNMPLFGLAKAARRIDVGGRAETAQGRLGVTDGTDAPEGVNLPIA